MVRTIIALLILCSAAEAQVAAFYTTGTNNCSDGTCRKVKRQGTAVCVGRSGDRDVWLTSGHAFRGLANITATVALDGGLENVDVVAWSIEPDIAVVTMPHKSRAIYFPLSSGMVAAGSEVTFVGYGPNPKMYTERRGAVVEENSSSVQAAIQVVSGDSGGPLLVQNNTVGIVWAAYGGRCLAVSATAAQNWINSKGVYLDPCRFERPKGPTPAQPRSPTPARPQHPQCDCRDLVARIERLESRSLPPDLTGRVQAIESNVIAIEVLDKEGNVHQRYSAPLGGTIQLAPTTVQILDSDKQVISENSYPSVGGTMKFRFKPSE